MNAEGLDARRIANLLDERSAALANRGRAQASGFEAHGAVQSFLVCTAAGERLGLPLRDVAGVLAGRACTPLPGAPPSLRGVIAHAGIIVSVLDLAAALGLTPVDEPQGPGHFVRLRQREPAIALAVESVLGVSEVSVERIGTALDGGEVGNRARLGAAAVSGYAAADPQAGAQAGFAVLDLPRLIAHLPT